MAKSSNPVFNSEAFKRQVKAGKAADAIPAPSVDQLEAMYSAPPVAPERMSVTDVLNKMLLMTAGILVGGFIGWSILARLAATAASLTPLMAVAGLAAIVALVIGIVNQVRAVTSPVLSLVYAVVEGFLLGTISALFELIYPGIVLQAVLGTGIVFVVCLLLFRSGKFRTTPRMRRIATIVGFSFVGFTLVNWLLAMATGGAFNLRTGWIGLAIGLFGICLGAFYLVTDFEDIEAAVRGGAPKSFAWRCAFGLTLSLVWIYVEMLRVLAILRELTN